MNSAPICFAADDKLSLAAFADDLEAFIATERHFVAGSLVISLNAPFGAGKSTFLQMWRSSLQEKRKSDQTLPIPIMLNTWESDHCGDPLLAIISGLTNELQAQGFARERVSDIREATKDIAWFGLGIANSFVANTTGIDAVGASELAEQKKSERRNSSTARPDLLSAFERRAKALNELKVLLDDIFQPDKLSAIVMVDELDRCRPDYAVEFLEAIKHVFTAKAVTFILAVDKTQLCSSAKTLFGHDLNFDEYYRKFAHRNIALPPVDNVTAQNLIRHYWKLIVAETNHRPISRTYAKYDETAAANFQEVAISLKLTPRQMQEMLRLFGHVMAMKHDKKSDLFWGFRVAATLMTGLAVGAPAVYEAIGNKRADFLIVRNALRELLAHKEHGEWWIMVMANGRAFNIASFDETLKQAKEVGLLATIQAGEHFKNQVAQFSEAWGHSFHGSPFSYVYSIIEKLRRFENARLDE